MAAKSHALSVFHEPVNRVWEASGLAGLTGVHEVPDHVVMSLFILVVVAALGLVVRWRLRTEEPGGLQQIVELTVSGLQGMIEDVIGHGAGRRFLPLIGGFALFIFFSNLSAQFFFLQPPTQTTNVTFALSITACTIYHVLGFRSQGIGYFKQLVGPGPPPWWIWPLMIPIELITHGARVLSLGVRLFGNIFGEHLAVGVIFGIVPLLLPIPLMALGLLAAVIQTFIFVMLTTVYIAGAESAH